jgi:hypothetical protein
MSDAVPDTYIPTENAGDTSDPFGAVYDRLNVVAPVTAAVVVTENL